MGGKLEPKLSYSAKTLLLEVVNTRRDFLKKGLITIGGISFLAFSLARPAKAATRSLTCGCYGDCHGQCYSNCHCECHGDCGRKGW